MSDADDEELAALRAAALASLKSRTVESSLTSSTDTNHIAPINTVVASTSNYAPYPGPYNASEQSSYSNQYSWRSPAQTIRRSRGNRSFPKISQRSNLIVITPVNTDDKNLEEKGSTSQLVLPQHKWCQSANEDSSSPKTYRRTGPTRFNRLESGSDSSDSDYDNSENDSYSNETILQDEPSDHFAGRSGESIGHESSPEKPVSERRLSFQNIDSDLNLESFQSSESTSVYKCLKTTYPSKSSEERPEVLRSPSVENDSEHSWKHESRRSYTYRQYDNVESKCSEQEYCSYSAKTRTVNGGSPKKHKLLSVLSPEADSSRSSRRPAEASQDNGSHSDLNSKMNHSNNDQSKLPENDLRLELKKRMQEFQSVSESSKKKSESPDSQLTGRSRSRDRSYLRSSRSRDRSEGKNHIHGSSSSQKNNRSRSRSANGRRSQSPHKNRSRRWSRSPEKHRRHSLDRHRRRDRSQSLVRDRKRNRNRSTQRNHKRDRNSSQDRKRDRSHSRDRKHSRSGRYHRGHSHTSSSSSTSSTSTSNSSSSLPLRSVSSVIKPAQPKDVGVKREKGSASQRKKTSSPEPDSHLPPKKSKKLDENNSVTSNVKSSVYSGENKSSASDGNKRVPVHMRLGSLPGKRVIQMTKDVEAAFVNTSSDDADEEVNVRHRKDNFRVVYDINDSKSEESSKKHFQRNSLRSTDTSKERRLKHRR